MPLKSKKARARPLNTANCGENDLITEEISLGTKTPIVEEEVLSQKPPLDQASMDLKATEASLRKSSFLRASQSDRITVLIGPSQTSFQVPQALLMNYSPPLSKMCQSVFLESSKRLIQLPQVKISAFEDFFIWIHVCEPNMTLQTLGSVLDLAVFAEIYMICHLKNQTSDVLRAKLSSGQWHLRPEDVSMVYDEVPSGAVLRRLCSVSLALPIQNTSTYGSSSSFGSRPNATIAHRQHSDYLEWKSVFEKHPDLGWDYFGRIQTASAPNVINAGGPCRFHDHGDVPGWKKDVVDECPYPRGALPTEGRTPSPPNGHQREVDHVMGNDGEEKAESVL